MAQIGAGPAQGQFGRQHVHGGGRLGHGQLAAGLDELIHEEAWIAGRPGFHRVVLVTEEGVGMHAGLVGRGPGGVDRRHRILDGGAVGVGQVLQVQQGERLAIGSQGGRRFGRQRFNGRIQFPERSPAGLRLRGQGDRRRVGTRQVRRDLPFLGLG